MNSLDSQLMGVCRYYIGAISQNTTLAVLPASLH